MIAQYGGLELLHREYPRANVAEQLAQNMVNRLSVIHRTLEVNIRASTGVPEAVDALRSLITAIDDLLAAYAGTIPPVDRQNLVKLLVNILAYIVQMDREQYNVQDVVQQQYASENRGNLYRRFISRQGEPGAFIGVLERRIRRGALQDQEGRQDQDARVKLLFAYRKIYDTYANDEPRRILITRFHTMLTRMLNLDNTAYVPEGG